MDLRSTLNLPSPEFSIPMKADLGIREPVIQQKWAEMGIYECIQEQRKDAPVFVLHDGPPYTNSPIHIGTAMNKILKDFVVKTRSMMGYRAPYVPGYDNHGLPIEQTVLKAFHERKESPDIVTLRKACREHAAKYIDIQSTQFQRLGVFGTWDRPYATMDFRYEAEIIRVFKRLAEQGYLYKGLRPTLWSPTSRTALADTEIIYEDHVSRSIFVRFPLKSAPNHWDEGYANVYTIIWTTTPWTIPANLAVAFHPEFEYVLVRERDAHYLIQKDLSEKVKEKVNGQEWHVVAEFLGASFEGSVFKHPIFDRDSIAVMAHYVTTEDGTGVVHTAPGHGRDDFFTGQKYGLPVLCPVDERGILTEEAGEFAGVSYKDCDTVVVDRLQELGALLHVEDYHHSYPHAERDNKPVIFRATEQWFISMDANDLRKRMLDGIRNKSIEEVGDNNPGVCWLPSSGYNRIEAMVRNRPDWCVSRQRPWGVGIPVLYGAESGVPVVDPVLIEAIAAKVEEFGSDVWYAEPASYFLPEGYVHPTTGETEFRKETDVLDVWFDSGCTSLCVLEGNVEPRWAENWPADVYLEGSDQHRGWFNSSLIIGTAIKGEPPYRTVITHGFVQDEKGLKMSKRLGNVVDPVEASTKLGADVVRYWCAGVDWTNDAPCSENILKQFGDAYRDIRNRLRFLLSNLYDYPNDPDHANPKIEGTKFIWTLMLEDVGKNGNHPYGNEHDLQPIDRWIVEQTELLVDDCVNRYAQYDFGGALTAIHNFCENELSSLYMDMVKDRLYCDGKDWPSRRSAQVASQFVLVQITKLMAPILVHTAEEVWERIPGKSASEPVSVHMATFGKPSSERIAEIEGSEFQSDFAKFFAIRSKLNGAFEPWKTANEVKDSQDVVASITDNEDTIALLRAFGDDLATFLKFSEIELAVGEPTIQFTMSTYEKCERSRLRRKDVELRDGVPLSKRDRQVLNLE